MPASELPGGRITLYHLFMDDGLFGDFQLISQASASLRQITVNNLVKGRSYRFKVRAEHFNQQGLDSDAAVLFACKAPR